MAEKDFDKDAIAAEIKNQASDSTDDSDAIANAEKNMEALGFDPKADEVVPDGKPVPAEDLEDIDDDDEKDDDLESDDKKDDDSTPEDDDDEPADKDDEEVDKDEDAQKGDKQKDEPQLSDAYYRAAIHSGMSEEEIAKFYKTDPELALKTFGTLYESMNRTSQEFAKLGRFKKEQAAKGDEKPEEKPDFIKMDSTELRTEMGDAYADRFDKQQEQLAQLHDNMSKAAPVVNNNDQELLDQSTKHAVEQIEIFFNAPDMVKYEQTYGVTKKGDADWAGLMPSAMMNRQMVIDTAEQLLEGAAKLDMEMSIPDALERAHLLTTQPIRDKIIRDDIMAKVVKRSKGITLKPSDKVAGTVGKSKGPKTAEEIVDRAEARLDKVFK